MGAVSKKAEEGKVSCPVCGAKAETPGFGADGHRKLGAARALSGSPKTVATRERKRTNVRKNNGIR